MDLSMKDDQVVLTMSQEEWAGFQSAFSSAWRFIADSVKESIPSGWTFGKAVNEEEGFQSWAARLIGEFQARIEVLERGLFSQTGDNRVSWLATRLSDETTRVNALRTMVHELNSKFDSHLQWAAQHNHPDNLAERITALEERVEARTLVDSPADWNRISGLEKELKRFESQTELKTSEDNTRIRVLEMSLGDIAAAQAALRERMDWIQEARASAQRTIDSELETLAREHGRRLVSIENELTGILEPRFKPVDWTPNEAELDTKPMHVLPENPLIEAEHRVRKALQRRGWATGSSAMEEVIGALHGGVVQAIQKDRRFIADHAFCYEAPDRRHCAFTNPAGEKCGQSPLRHSRP